MRAVFSRTLARSHIALALSLVIPFATAAAQVSKAPTSASLLGAAAEFVRDTWLTPIAILEVDPRQARTAATVIPGEVMHDPKSLSGVARRGAIVVAKLDSARACAGEVNPAHPCRLDAFAAFTAPVIRGDSASVIGFLRALNPANNTARGPVGSVTFSLVLQRIGGAWRVVGKRDTGRH